MSDESSRSSWSDPPTGWTFADHLLRAEGGSPKYMHWHGVLKEFEIELEWREISAADDPWRKVRLVAHADNSCVGLQGEQRIDRAADGTDPVFRVGPVEVTLKQSKLGWRIALRPGKATLEVRNMVLRDHKELGMHGTVVPLFDGQTLDGWRSLGDAKFSVQAGALVGEVGGGSQSFLCSNGTYSDFILDADVKNDLPGNSGIQFRSHENAEKRLFGYQIEIDPSARAWSGGLYDEARRGWLDDLSDNPLGRAAFKNGEWNHYRIECVGTRIRAWVNDVPTADYVDATDLEGVIGLQVHSGKDTKIRWKNLHIREVGQSSWGAVETGLDDRRCDVHGNAVRLHFQVPPTAAGVAPSLQTLTLHVDGWTQVFPIGRASGTTCEVLVLCSQRRVAIELDGQALPASPWVAPDMSKDPDATGTFVSWDGPWKLESAEEIGGTNIGVRR